MADAGDTRATVLVIEDDPDVRDALDLALRRARLEVVMAPDGRSGLRCFHERRPDLVVLDLGLPDVDGLVVLSRIRDLSNLPILLLSARDLEFDKVRGLVGGADDYLTKPFGMQELLARLQALLRRVPPAEQPAGPGVIVDERYGLRVDVEAHAVEVGGAPVELTPVEWRLLLALARHRGKVLSPQQLLDQAWGDPVGVGPERVKFAVLRLRRKLGPAGALVQNVRSFGYRLD